MNHYTVEVLIHINRTIQVAATSEDEAFAAATEMARVEALGRYDRDDVVLVEANSIIAGPF